MKKLSFHSNYVMHDFDVIIYEEFTYVTEGKLTKAISSGWAYSVMFEVVDYPENIYTGYSTKTEAENCAENDIREYREE